MKNSNDPIGNRTRDLPACSAMPHLTENYYRVMGLIIPHEYGTHRKDAIFRAKKNCGIHPKQELPYFRSYKFQNSYTVNTVYLQH